MLVWEVWEEVWALPPLLLLLLLKLLLPLLKLLLLQVAMEGGGWCLGEAVAGTTLAQGDWTDRSY